MEYNVTDRFVSSRTMVQRRLPSHSVVLPNTWLTRMVLISSDLAAVAVAGVLASALWARVQPLADPRSFVLMWPLAAAIPVGFMFMGLYPAVGVGVVQELRRSTLFVTAVFGTAVAVLFLTKQAAGASRGIYLLAWLLIVAAIPLARGLVRHLLARRAWWGVSAVVLGAGKTAELLLKRVLDHAGTDLKVLACFDDDAKKHGTSIGGVTVLGGLEAVAGFRRAYRPHYAIVAMPGVAPDKLSPILRSLVKDFPHLVVVPNVFGMASVGIGARDFGGVVGLYDKQNLLLLHNRVLKHLLDAALVLPLALFALPIVAICALAVMLVDTGNPFYAQEREGYGGKPIRIWKLRTMRRNADAYLEKYLQDDSEARAEWEKHFKLSHDPRVLPVVGRLLRRSSLDELPQLLNILLGQMSVVGPRPFPYYHLDSFDHDFRELRTSVMPGLTGYWQVTSRSVADIDAQEQLDSYYIRNWSLWLDVYILARTPGAVLFGKGAY